MLGLRPDNSCEKPCAPPLPKFISSVCTILLPYISLQNTGAMAIVEYLKYPVVGSPDTGIARPLSVASVSVIFVAGSVATPSRGGSVACP